MSLLTPLFLVALAGVAIPILLHLIQKERRNVVQFPSLMFLRRIPYQSVQRRRIRHWLLLAMRLAALALLVLAFARPFFRSRDLGAAAAQGAREVVVLLDRSYSMGYGDRWQRALGAARQAVGALGSSDKASIVLFDAGAEVALRSTGDRTRLQASIAAARIGAGVTRFGPALKLAGTILAESALPRREVVLVSDFQRVGWQGADGVRLPDGATLNIVSVADPEPVNLTIAPVALQRSVFEGQQRVTITSGVLNRGTGRASNVEIVLEVGGRPIQSQRIDVAPGGSASVTFEPVTIAEPNLRATVRLADDALVRDNSFHFVLSPESPVGIVIADRTGSTRDSSLYLARALAVSESPKFEVAQRFADSILPDDLGRASVVIVNDAPVAESTATRLHGFVERGGGLLVGAGDKGSWPQSVDVLPAAFGRPVDRSTGAAGRLGALEYGHPVFEIFRAPRSGDFSAARFYGYRAATPLPGTRTLARFDDGAAALLERRVGVGRVLLWTSSFDLYWNDLALKPVFLPFLHSIVRHLAAYREPEPWRTVGDVVEPPPSAAARGADSVRVVLAPNGERVTLDEEGPDVLQLTDQGFYEIRMQGRDAQPPVVVASNVDLAESDLTPMDPREVVAAAVGRAGGPSAAETESAPTDEAQEAAQRIWWYLLFAALLVLAAETIVANRSAV